MIYTVTLNPSLDYIVSVENFTLGRTNRTVSEAIMPGGKGINISIVLKNLGLESTALGYVAGFTGNEILRQLKQLQVASDFITIEGGQSRINFKLQSIEGTEINGHGPRILEEEIEALMDKLCKLQKGDILFLAGSVPTSMPVDIYQQIMVKLEEKGVVIVVDATRELLIKVLPHHPFLIKPNHCELGEIFGVVLKNRKEVISYGLKLQEMGARNVLISLAEEGAVLLTEDGRCWEAEALEGTVVNSVGAGDSMVAGFMTGWMERKDYKHAFCRGLAAASASVFSEGLANKKEADILYDRILSEGKVYDAAL